MHLATLSSHHLSCIKMLITHNLWTAIMEEFTNIWMSWSSKMIEACMTTMTFMIITTDSTTVKTTEVVVTYGRLWTLKVSFTRNWSVAEFPKGEKQMLLVVFISN